MANHENLSRARLSLDGLSVGDAFGDRFFGLPERAEMMIERRGLPAPPWRFTDDTVMAISVAQVLAEKGFVDRDRLALLFGERYRRDPDRKYGGTAHGVLTRIAAGEPWPEAAAGAWEGEGSMGNGGAMRAAPVGAYFCDDYAAVVANARHSAEVTHAHPEGQAGAIAVAVAAAWVARGGGAPAELFATVLEHTPEGETRGGIAKASRLDLSYDVRTAVAALGNGMGVVSQDTVPLTLWCVARHLGDYEEALWTTVAALGDRDTTCAIVGGIAILHAAAKIPDEWLDSREPLAAMSLDILAK